MRKKKKITVSTFLFMALVLIGLGVLFYPTLSDLYTRYQISRELRQYNEVLEADKADYSALWKEAEEYNRSLAGKANHLFAGRDEYELTYKMLNPNDSSMLGYIEIPAINIELPIYRGTEEKQLQSGAGWWVGSSLPTGGDSTHCIITAHTGLAKAKLFTDLDRLKEGDRFTITVLDRTMSYEVDQILVTDPDDMEPLQVVEGEDYVTLYTCTPYGVNTHRLLVRGHRTASEEKAVPTQQETSDRTWMIAIPVCVLFVVLILWLIRRNRKKRREHLKDLERR